MVVVFLFKALLDKYVDMGKKNKVTISVLVVFLTIVIGVFKFSFISGYKISIDNNTNIYTNSI